MRNVNRRGKAFSVPTAPLFFITTAKVDAMIVPMTGYIRFFDEPAEPVWIDNRGISNKVIIYYL